ncbi:hypothetical protein ABW21_db0206169 [Orbilia brochopaga]|nr:hypothetical protein ABW21_db0206169 [Drechslerella brochopaga]
MHNDGKSLSFPTHVLAGGQTSGSTVMQLYQDFIVGPLPTGHFRLFDNGPASLFLPHLTWDQGLYPKLVSTAKEWSGCMKDGWRDGISTSLVLQDESSFNAMGLSTSSCTNGSIVLRSEASTSCRSLSIKVQ